MLKKFSIIILKLFGWKIKGSIPEDIKKLVLIVAPHTSNIDFIIGKIASFYFNRKLQILIKKELFFFPLNIILKSLGAIPVNREKASGIVEQIVNKFNNNDSFILSITPEGTRSYNKNWKKGYYYIAQKADVPIAIGFLDYKKKEVGIEKIISTSGDYKNDFKIIQDIYKTKTAKYPKKFNLSEIYNN